MVDYIVVGLGLAGIAFCEMLEKEGKSFTVITDDSQKASQVAGGLYNPVILKRLTLAWKGAEQCELAKPFYTHLEQKLGVCLDYPIPVLRRLASVAEQNAWFAATDRPGLDAFLSPSLIPNTNSALHAPYGFGKVQHTGRIDTSTLLSTYTTYLNQKSILIRESFDFSELTLQKNCVLYKAIQAKYLVFACGYGLKNNPFFKYLPLQGTKGELLTIKAPDYNENRIIKSSVFSIPLGADCYRIGATYKWKDKTNLPTEASKMELLEKLTRFLKCDFEVIDHLAGIRPTVVDRRPLVGQHPVYKNLYVLNGLGSRGVLIAPYVSRQLLDAIENKKPLDPEINIQRFTEKYYTGSSFAAVGS